MAGPGGFDFNAWQQQQGGRSAAQDTPAESPNGLIQADRWVTTLTKIFGASLGIEGQGVIKDTNVGGGGSLTNISLLKDAPGGVLSRLLKYFTRDLPAGLMDSFTGGGDAASSSDSSAASTGASSSAAGTGGFDSDAMAMSGPATMPIAVNSFAETYSGSRFEFADADRAMLGALSPPATGPAVRSADMGMAV